jgi:K+-sensing histidine kinase KdpD
MRKIFTGIGAHLILSLIVVCVFFSYTSAFSDQSQTFLNNDHFYHFVTLLISVNVFLLIFGYFTQFSFNEKERLQLEKDQYKLLFDNLLFYIENLNHEVNNPMFIMSKKIKEIKHNSEKGLTIKENSFNTIDKAINQIQKLMSITKIVKNINRESEDKTIKELLEITMTSILIMRAEHFISVVSDDLDKFYLNQDKFGNAYFVNVVTGIIKVSIETFADDFRFEVENFDEKTNKLSIIIKDNGNGLEDIRSSIFSKKNLGDNDNLYIMKEILMSCGGNIKIVDTKVGETKLRITIPVTPIIQVS